MQWLTKATAKSHTLREIVKQFNCSEQGAKNALTRRGITECKVRPNPHTAQSKLLALPDLPSLPPKSQPAQRILPKSFPIVVA